MLKFFRAIRQKLVSDGKTGKYLKYAIGEILLVVIGILIALQINTWQKDRIDRREENSMLLRFKSDLQEDVLTLNNMTKFSKNWCLNVEKILQGISEKKLGTEDFLKHNSDFGFYGKFEKIKGTYKEAIGSGKLDLIQNKNLKYEILKFYERTDYGSDEVMNEQMNNYILPTFFKIISPTKEAALVVTKENYELEPINMNQIYQNKEYHAILIAKLGLMKTQIQQWETQKNRVELLLKLIEEELTGGL